MSNVIEAPAGVSPAEYMRAVAAQADQAAQAPARKPRARKPRAKAKSKPAAENAVSVRLVDVDPARLAAPAAVAASAPAKKYRYDREFIPDMAHGPFAPFLEALNRRGEAGWRIYEKVPGRKKVPQGGGEPAVDASGYTVVWEMEVVA